MQLSSGEKAFTRHAAKSKVQLNFFSNVFDNDINITCKQFLNQIYSFFLR